MRTKAFRLNFCQIANDINADSAKRRLFVALPCAARSIER